MRFLRFALFALLAAVAGCNRVGPLGGSDAGSESGADSDADSDSDSDLPFFGRVSLAFTRYENGEGALRLWAAFFDEQPAPEDGSSYVGTFPTPGGAECDIFYYSELDVQPEMPVQIDAGEIRAGLHDGGDYLSVVFEDGAYTVDVRSVTDDPIPEWAYDPEQEFYFDILGSAIVPALSRPAAMPSPGYFTSPPPGTEDLFVGEDGAYAISWDQFGGDAALVVASFNLDWDTAWFVCRPAEGAWGVDIPAEWIEEHTWGGGAQLQLWFLNEYEMEGGGGLVEAEAAQVFEKNAYFHDATEGG